jgi:ABC-2 type transport system permease protein
MSVPAVDDRELVVQATRQRAEQLAALPLLPAGPTSGFISGTLQSARDIWNYRQLLHLLFRRELKARYKDSVLGFFWSLLRPLAQLLVYAIAIGEFLGASRGGSDYPIYVFSGLTIWQLFSEIVSGGTGSILANGGLVKKIYLPREVFPLSVVGSALFNFLMQVCILVIATVIVGAPPTGSRLGYAVLALGLIVVYATAFAFVLGAVNVYLRDVQYLVEIGLMWGMWTAPIVYRWSFVSPHLHNDWVRSLYLANPITEAVLGFQRAFWVRGTAADSPAHLGRNMLLTILVGLVLLWICQRIFARLQNNFAQEL